MKLFHFSDDPGIARFEPRPVRVASRRPADREWLNGPLVWTIDDWHQPMYLFPRECPRILTWPTPTTSPADLARWWTPRPGRMAAYIEREWIERLRAGVLYRYELPIDAFESLDDAGMWVARETVEPVAMEVLTDLWSALRAADVALQAVDELEAFRPLWESTMHASGIRLRNARTWAPNRA